MRPANPELQAVLGDFPKLDVGPIGTLAAWSLQCDHGHIPTLKDLYLCPDLRYGGVFLVSCCIKQLVNPKTLEHGV